MIASVVFVQQAAMAPQSTGHLSSHVRVVKRHESPPYHWVTAPSPLTFLTSA